MKRHELQIVVATGALISVAALADGIVRDPGVRTGAAGAGQALAGLRDYERTYFDAGLEQFNEAEMLEDGLGPRFNLDGCAGCHAQPATGGHFAGGQSAGDRRHRFRGAQYGCLHSSDRMGRYVKHGSVSRPAVSATAACTHSS